MGESVEFKVRLDDQVSAAAKRSSTAVERLGNAVRRIRGPAASSRKMVGKLGTSVNNLGGAMGKTSAATAGTTGGIAGLATRIGLANIVVQLASRAFAALARAAVTAGRAVAESALYMDGMRYSLSKFLGSAKAGTEQMAKLLDVSDDLGISFRDAAGTFKSFVSAGLTADMAHEMVRFRADLEAVANTEKDLERLQEAFIQIEKAVATGRLEMDGFTSILAGLPGVTEESIFAKLAPMMGKTEEQLKKMEKTKLPVPLLLKAIKAAFLEATGATELGALAIEKQLETVGGAFTAFKNVAGNALLRLGDELAPMLKDELMPLFQDLTNELKSPEGRAAIKDLASAIATTIKVALKLGKALYKGITAGLKFMKPNIDGIVKVIGKLTGEGDALETWAWIFEKVGYAVGVVIGAIAGAIMTIALIGAAMGAAATAVGDAIDSITSYFENLSFEGLISDWSSWGSSLGGAIIKGIIIGLTGGMAGVILTLVDLAKKAIDAAKGSLGIASPSKVFEGIGGQVAAGMGRGIESAAPEVNASAAGMIDPKKMGNMGGTTNNFNTRAPVQMTVHGTANPYETAAIVKQTLEAEMTNIFEAATLQVSVVGNA